MSWLNWLLPLAALYPLFHGIRIWLVMRTLLGLRFGPRRLSVPPPENLPAWFREAVALMEPEFRAAGFHALGGLEISSAYGEPPVPGMVFGDAAGTMFLSCVPHVRIERAGELLLSIGSFLANGDELLTTNQRPDKIFPVPASVRQEAMANAFLATLLARHRERLAAATAAGTPALTPTLEEWQTLVQKRFDAIGEALHATGQFHAGPDGRFMLRIAASARLAVSLLREESRIKKENKKQARAVAPVSGPLPPPLLSRAALVEFDYYDYLRLVATQSGRMTWVPKLFFMVVSLALFALVLGWTISWQGVVALVVVLIFHECGHLLGMRLVGHRDTQLLFLPFFGGAAVALDAPLVKPWQQLVMLFLGPLPGLFIAYALIFLGLTGPGWGNQFTITLLVLNLFNLLPVLPLDGGQIVDTALLARFPRARIFFLGLSGVALVGVMIAVRGGTVIGALGLLMLTQLQKDWMFAGLLRRLRRQLPPGASEDTVVHRLLAELRNPEWNKIAPVLRLQRARILQRSLRQPLPGWGTLVFALAGYLSPLWVPLAVLGGIYGASLPALHRAEADAEAAGLHLTEPPPSPLADDLAGSDNAAIYYEMAFEDHPEPARAGASRGKTPPLSPQARAALIDTIRNGAAEKLFAPSDPRDVDFVSPLCSDLLTEVRRLADAGDPILAAALIDDLLKIAAQMDQVPSLEAVSVRITVLNTALRGVEYLNARSPQPDWPKRWALLLDEAHVRADVLRALDYAARAAAHPPLPFTTPGARSGDTTQIVNAWFDWAPRGRTGTLNLLTAIRRKSAADDFGLPSFGADEFDYPERIGPLRPVLLGQMASLGETALRLTVRQRLAHVAAALQSHGTRADLTALPADLSPSPGTAPLTHERMVLVHDASGARLLFPQDSASRGTKPGGTAAEMDLDSRAPVRGIEWWLTPRKLPREAP